MADGCRNGRTAWWFGPPSMYCTSSVLSGDSQLLLASASRTMAPNDSPGRVLRSDLIHPVDGVKRPTSGFSLWFIGHKCTYEKELKGFYTRGAGDIDALCRLLSGACEQE